MFADFETQHSKPQLSIISSHVFITVVYCFCIDNMILFRCYTKVRQIIFSGIFNVIQRSVPFMTHAQTSTLGQLVSKASKTICKE